MIEAPSITLVVLTFDEALHIRRCIERAAGLVQRVVVVDSFSTDDTMAIARACGAEVHQRPFKHQADQFQWALDNCAIDTDWVLRLDADEYLEPALIRELADRVPAAAPDVTGFLLKLKVVFRGRWIRHGGYYRTWLLRLWRTGAGGYEQRWMDERVALTKGHAVRATKGDLVDENLRDIGWWTAKHNRYATRHMIDFIAMEQPIYETNARNDRSIGSHVTDRRFLRNVVFARAPLYIRSVLYFFQRYILRLGFLDGREGFVWHFLQGFWYFVLIDAKIDEARRYISTNGVSAFRHYVAEVHGIEIVRE